MTPQTTRPFNFAQFSEIYRQYDTGVYGIVHPVRLRAYVGATQQSFRHRWNQHRSELENRVHANQGLQRDWAIDGGQAFRFVVFQELELTARMTLYERFWIESLREASIDCYNVLAPMSPLPIAEGPRRSSGLPNVEVLTVPEIARFLRMGPRTIERWIDQSALHAFSVNGEWRVPRQALETFLASGRKKPSKPLLPPRIRTVTIESVPTRLLDVVIYDRRTQVVESIAGRALRADADDDQAGQRFRRVSGLVGKHQRAAMVRSGMYQAGDPYTGTFL
jgi:excisionase family DNA binding protein